MAGRRSERALYLYIPAIFTLACLIIWSLDHTVGADFISEYRLVALRTLHGGDPWRWGELAILNRQGFPYPATAALVFIPAAVLPSMVGYVIFTLLCICGVGATLWMCDVRDSRLYGVALLWAPVVWSWRVGNLTLPLVLGIALVWRTRDKPWISGATTALLICLKLFVWPLGLWLIATRRYRASAIAIAVGLALNLVSWSVYGWNRLDQFLHLSTRIAHALDGSGYGLVSLMNHLGLGWLGWPAMVAISAFAGLGAVILARRHDDARALTLAVVLMLAASPLIWIHYFAVLLVPLAILRPKIGRAWWAPVLLWIVPVAAPTLWQIIWCWLICTYVVVECLRAGEAVDHGPLVLPQSPGVLGKSATHP